MFALRFLLLAALLLVVGCSDEAVTDPPDDDPGPQDTLPLVSAGEAGRDRAIENLETSYATLDIEEYERLIGALFVFVVDPDVANVVGDDLSRVEDLESTQRMFSGENGVRPVLDDSGQPTGEYESVPPLQQITISLAPASGSGWQEITTAPYAGSWRRVHDLSLSLTYAGGALIEFVAGKQVLYLSAGTIQVAGDETVEVWQLRAWEDQGVGSRAVARDGARDSQALSLSEIKASYR